MNRVAVASFRAVRKWGVPLGRLRNSPAEKEPLLLETAERLAEIARHRIEMRCEQCDGNGPIAAVVLAWRVPIGSGGKRERGNIHASCLGCWQATGRRDGLPVLRGAGIARAEKPYEPQSIICLG